MLQLNVNISGFVIYKNGFSETKNKKSKHNFPLLGHQSKGHDETCRRFMSGFCPVCIKSKLKILSGRVHKCLWHRNNTVVPLFNKPTQITAISKGDTSRLLPPPLDVCHVNVISCLKICKYSLVQNWTRPPSSRQTIQCHLAAITRMNSHNKETKEIRSSLEP